MTALAVKLGFTLYSPAFPRKHLLARFRRIIKTGLHANAGRWPMVHLVSPTNRCRVCV